MHTTRFSTALEAILVRNEISQKEAATKAEITPTQLGRIIMGTSNASAASARKIIHAPGLLNTPNRLKLAIAFLQDAIAGIGFEQGSFRISAVEHHDDLIEAMDKDYELIRQHVQSYPYMAKGVSLVADVLREIGLGDQLPSNVIEYRPATVEIPIAGEIAAGSPAASGEPNGDTMAVDAELAKKAGKNATVVRVSGRSMEPTIMDGSHILIRKTASVKDGDIVVAMVDGDMTLKKLQGTELVSINRRYSKVSPRDEATITGKYIATL